MAVKKLPGQEPKAETKKAKAEDQEKLNVREYYKAENTKDGEAFGVVKVKLTMSGWLIVETEEWVGFIHGKAAVSVNLINTLAPQLHGKQANQLVAIAAKKSKFGFVLGLEDEVKRWYSFNPEANLLEITEEQEESFLIPTEPLKIEDFFATK